MRKVIGVVELVKGDDYVIVEVGSRAHEHFASLEYLVKGESVEEEKPKRRGRAKSLTLPQNDIDASEVHH